MSQPRADINHGIGTPTSGDTMKLTDSQRELSRGHRLAIFGGQEAAIQLD